MTSMLEGGRGFMKKWTNADREEGGIEPTRTSMKMTNSDHLAWKAKRDSRGRKKQKCSLT